MKVSIIIPFKEVNSYIFESIPYLLKLDHEDYEILLIPDHNLGFSDKLFSDKRIRIIESGAMGPAQKRDIGASRAKGEVLAFIDDDAYPKKDWLQKVVRNFKGNVAAVGGPAITPKNDSPLQKASGMVFETFSGGGGMDYRYRPKARRLVDDYPTVNFCVLKKVFLESGGFDSNYWPGEDTEFCLKIIKKGYKIMYEPDAIVYHHRRSLYGEHLKQISQYGRHRGKFARIFPETSFRLTYFIPSLFVIFIFFGIALSFFYSQIALLFLVAMIFYFVILSFDVAIRVYSIRIFILSVLGIFFTHVIYGINFMRGFLSGGGFRSKLR